MAIGAETGTETDRAAVVYAERVADTRSGSD
jgi:hypothetical protein